MHNPARLSFPPFTVSQDIKTDGMQQWVYLIKDTDTCLNAKIQMTLSFKRNTRIIAVKLQFTPTSVPAHMTESFIKWCNNNDMKLTTISVYELAVKNVCRYIHMKEQTERNIMSEARAETRRGTQALWQNSIGNIHIFGPI